MVTRGRCRNVACPPPPQEILNYSPPNCGLGPHCARDKDTHYANLGVFVLGVCDKDIINTANLLCLYLVYVIDKHCANLLCLYLVYVIDKHYADLCLYLVYVIDKHYANLLCLSLVCWIQTNTMQTYYVCTLCM